MDRDKVTATVRIGGRMYTCPHTVARTRATGDAERDVRADLIQHLREHHIDYTATDLDTVRFQWTRDGMPISRAER